MPLSVLSALDIEPIVGPLVSSVVADVAVIVASVGELPLLSDPLADRFDSLMSSTHAAPNSRSASTERDEIDRGTDTWTGPPAVIPATDVTHDTFITVNIAPLAAMPTEW
ncbi:MAG TPA: hypothetical protein VG755_22080 [Nannocystaceae bacterium]|nr:hypothetical protein [Nannocystaceae bacterium]